MSVTLSRVRSSRSLMTAGCAAAFGVFGLMWGPMSDRPVFGVAGWLGALYLVFALWMVVAASAVLRYDRTGVEAVWFGRSWRFAWGDLLSAAIVDGGTTLVVVPRDVRNAKDPRLVAMGFPPHAHRIPLDPACTDSVAAAFAAHGIRLGSGDQTIELR
jgi:hypothetical protein